MSERPTRDAHLEECRLISVALIEGIRADYEAAKFRADLWELTPCPPREEWM